MKQFISFWDYLLLPIVIAFVYIVANAIRNRYYPKGHPWRRYFMKGLSVKILGAIFVGLIYQYYYGGGDTANYFLQAKTLNSSFSESPIKWLNLLIGAPDWFDSRYQQYISHMRWYGAWSSYTVIVSTALLNIFTFNTYLPTSVLFAFVSYSGIWAMFRTFAKLYPHLLHPVALATLFIPSTFIWGSGVFKDTICLFGLGWMIYGTYQLLVLRNFNTKTILLFLFSAMLIFKVKKYILVAFAPSLMLWVVARYGDQVKMRLFKPILFTISAIIFAASLFLFSSVFKDELGQYSLENVAETSRITRDYILRSTDDEGSGYDLGTIDPTPLGFLKKVPAGINVTLFRPYLWESGKIIVFFNALESLLLLLLTLKVIFSLGPARLWRAFMGDGTLQFCLVFALIFAFAIGISTYNFGSLSRYRIPCLPLYGMALVLLYYSKNPPEKKLLSFRL